VVVITERFHPVAMATLRSQRFPESIIVEIKGNPEFIDDEALSNVAKAMAGDIARCLAKKN
jgi:hypothetical protein